MSPRSCLGVFLVLVCGCVARPGIGEGETSEGGESETDTPTSETDMPTSETDMPTSESTGPSGESESGDTETSASESETSESETETETGEPPEPCESDTDCEPGNCVEGSCVICEEDWDCAGSVEFCMDNFCEAGTCVVGPKDCTVSGCHQGFCNEGQWGGAVCDIELCEEYDGVVDVEIDMVAVGWTPPTELDLDQSVRVIKYDEPVCSTIDVVRAIDGPLLLAHTWAGEPNGAGWTNLLVETFGGDWGQLTAPLQTHYYDHEACPVIDDGCGDTARGIAEVQLGDELAQIADRQVGWAPGGYFVNAHDMEFRDDFCIQLQGAWTINATLMRDACTDDCPAPTLQAGCFPPLEEAHPAGFSVRVVLEHWDYVNADFECVVIESSVGVNEQGDPLEHRGLDCVPLLQPTQHPECEH